MTTNTIFDIGVDIGGSHISVGFVDRSSHSIIHQTMWDIDDTWLPEKAIDRISSSIHEIYNKILPNCIGVVGIGCPGQTKNGILVNSSNLPLFKNAPLASTLHSKLKDVSIDVPVVLLNDADAAIFSELKSIKSKNKYNKVRNACMITVGTGIGVSLFLNGAIFQGSNGMIEAGHTIIDFGPSARQCGCGQKGCVEAYASAKSTCLRMAERDRSNPTSHSPPAGTDSSKMNAKAIFDREADGDPEAAEVLDTTFRALAILCINLCRTVDPEVIVLAGGMALAGESFRQKVEEYVKKLCGTVIPTDVKMTLSHSTTDSGLLGAAIAAYEMSQR